MAWHLVKHSDKFMFTYPYLTICLIFCRHYIKYFTCVGCIIYGPHQEFIQVFSGKSSYEVIALEA